MVISDEILQVTQMTEDELVQELAILLYQKEKMTLGQASKLAGMSQLQFQFLLGSRNVRLHFDIADLEADLHTLRDLGRL